MKKQSSAVEPVVTDTAINAAAEKEKADEKGKLSKADARKGKDKGDKKVCIQLCCAIYYLICGFISLE